jgi:anti-sigma factor RsiW
MKRPQHISNDLLVRFLDDESPAAEASAVEQHLNSCAECRQRYHDLNGVSKCLESFVGSVSPRFSPTGREVLVEMLNTQGRPSAPLPQKVLKRFAWGMALAASLALSLMMAPQFSRTRSNAAAGVPQEQQSASLLEVDGETFVPLPYSNPDLPMRPHIVEMQVPVSSLTDAGVHFEAISNEVSSGDESVLADVLLGIDGQPLGVHVLSVE